MNIREKTMVAQKIQNDLGHGIKPIRHMYNIVY